MVLIIFYTLTDDSPNLEGKYTNMQAAGSFVFTSIVIVVNMKILISSFEITLILLFLVIASIASYFAAFWFLTYYSAEADDFGVFYELITFAQTYMTLIFFTFSYVLIDAGMRFASLEINAIFLRRKELQEYQERLYKKAQAQTAIQTKITKWESKYCSCHL